MSEVKIIASQWKNLKRISITEDRFNCLSAEQQNNLIEKDKEIIRNEKATAADRQKFIQEFKRISAIEFEPYAKSFNLLQELKDDFENELRKTVVDKVKVIKKEIRRLYEKLTPIQRQGFELDDSFHSETLKEVFIHFIETNSLIKPYLNPWYHNSDDDNLIVKPGQAIEYCKQLAEGFNYRLYVEYLNNILKPKDEEPVKSLKELLEAFNPDLYDNMIKWLLNNGPDGSESFYLRDGCDKPHWLKNGTIFRAFHEKIKGLLPSQLQNNNKALARMYLKTFSFSFMVYEALRTDSKAPNYHYCLNYFNKMPLN